MKQFVYTISDPLGIHARPAGLLVRKAKEFGDTVITIEKNGAAVRTSQLMKLMTLGVKQGDQVQVTADGPAENEAIDAMKRFFEENL